MLQSRIQSAGGPIGAALLLSLLAAASAAEARPRFVPSLGAAVDVGPRGGVSLVGRRPQLAAGPHYVAELGRTLTVGRRGGWSWGAQRPAYGTPRGDTDRLDDYQRSLDSWGGRGGATGCAGSRLEGEPVCPGGPVEYGGGGRRYDRGEPSTQPCVYCGRASAPDEAACARCSAYARGRNW